MVFITTAPPSAASVRPSAKPVGPDRVELIEGRLGHGDHVRVRLCERPDGDKGPGLQAIGVTLNWITHTADQFAERSPGFYLNSASTCAVLPGAVILAAGVLSNL